MANQKEADFIEYLERATGLTLSREPAHLALPYRAAGTRMKADAVWFAPSSSPYKGIVIEVQGMGKHSNIVGITNDCRKSAIAQTSGWLVFAWPYRQKELGAKMLQALSERAIALSEGPLY